MGRKNIRAMNPEHILILELLETLLYNESVKFPKKTVYNQLEGLIL